MGNFLTNARQIARRDSTALMVANLAAAVAGILSGVVAARALGPAGRGDLAVVIFWPALLATLVDLGIAEALTFRCASHPSRAARLSANALWLATAAGAAGVAAGVAALPFLLRPDQAGLLRLSYLALSLVPVSLLSAVPIGALMGLGRFRAVAAIRLVGVAIYTTSMLAAVSMGIGTVPVLMWLTVASRAVPAILAIPFVARTITSSPQEAHKPGALTAQFADGARFHGARLASVLAGAEDKGLASLMLDATRVGLWQVAASLIVVMQFVSQAESQTLFANLAQGVDGKEEVVLRAYVRATAITAAAAVCGMAALPFVVPWVYGADFVGAVPSGLIALIGSVVAAGTATLQAAAKAARWTRACIASEVLAMGVMAAVAIGTVQTLGLPGLAVAHLAGRTAALTAMQVVAHRVFGLRYADMLPLSRRFFSALRGEGEGTVVGGSGALKEG